jgi:hypothetical protein
MCPSGTGWTHRDGIPTLLQTCVEVEVGVELRGVEVRLQLNRSRVAVGSGSS